MAETSVSTGEDTKAKPSRLLVLRPLVWWLLLVLALYAVRTHQRLSEKTRLTFNASLKGRPVLVEARVGNGVMVSGGRMPIGWHRISFSHPKAESFSTNLFIWYG